MPKQPLPYLRRRLPGFSLIELALVLIVIGILAALFLRDKISWRPLKFKLF